MKEYKKSCEDEIDWNSINQLHEATLQLSKSCFEFKKICVGLIGASLAVLVKLTANKIGLLYFLIPTLICLGFWIADSSAYYYQRKTRMVMNGKLDKIALRNGLKSYNPDKLNVTWIMAVFNSSMVLYYVFISLIALGLVYFKLFYK